MTRTLTNTIINELDNDTVRPFFAVKLEFPSGTLRLWTGLQDISISSETYTGVGSFLGVSSVEESEELKATGLELTLSGIPTSLIGTMLTDNYQGSLVTVFFGFLTEFGGSVQSPLADPFIVYKGLADTLELSENTENVTAKLKVESRLIAMEEARNRRYTDEDQKIDFSSDNSLRFVAGLQDKEITWGKS